MPDSDNPQPGISERTRLEAEAARLTRESHTLAQQLAAVENRMGQIRHKPTAGDRLRSVFSSKKNDPLAKLSNERDHLLQAMRQNHSHQVATDARLDQIVRTEAQAQVKPVTVQQGQGVRTAPPRPTSPLPPPTPTTIPQVTPQGVTPPQVGPPLTSSNSSPRDEDEGALDQSEEVDRYDVQGPEIRGVVTPVGSQNVPLRSSQSGENEGDLDQSEEVDRYAVQGPETRQVVPRMVPQSDPLRSSDFNEDEMGQEESEEVDRYAVQGAQTPQVTPRVVPQNAPLRSSQSGEDEGDLDQSEEVDRYAVGVSDVDALRDLDDAEVDMSHAVEINPEDNLLEAEEQEQGEELAQDGSGAKKLRMKPLEDDYRVGEKEAASRKVMIRGEEVEVHEKAWLRDKLNAQRKADGLPELSEKGWRRNGTAQSQPKTQYFNEEQRDAHKATPEDGILKQGSEKLKPGGHIFAMDGDGQIYTEHSDELTSKRDHMWARADVHHSSFLAGEDVAGAGEMLIGPTGKLEVVTDRSGHYKPGQDQNAQVLESMKEQGVSLDTVKFMLDRDQEKVTGPANVYLAGKVTPEEEQYREKLEAQGQELGDISGVMEESFRNRIDLESEIRTKGESVRDTLRKTDNLSKVNARLQQGMGRVLPDDEAPKKGPKVR